VRQAIRPLPAALRLDESCDPRIVVRPDAQPLDGADPASPVFGFHAILVLAGRAAHLEAVIQTARGLVGCRGGRGVMDEGLVALAVAEPGESVLMPGSRLVRLDGCEVWETVHVTLRRRCRAGEGGRVQDVSLWGSWRCGRPA